MTWLYAAFISDEYALRHKEDNMLPFLFGLSENLEETLQEMQKYHYRVAIIYDYVPCKKPAATLLGLQNQLKSYRIAESSWYNLSFADVDALMKVIDQLNTDDHPCSV
jgi:hypothetical protein